MSTGLKFRGCLWPGALYRPTITTAEPVRMIILVCASGVFSVAPGAISYDCFMKSKSSGENHSKCDVPLHRWRRWYIHPPLWLYSQCWALSPSPPSSTQASVLSTSIFRQPSCLMSISKLSAHVIIGPADWCSFPFWFPFYPTAVQRRQWPKRLLKRASKTYWKN